jgi:hypothetical protein
MTPPLGVILVNGNSKAGSGARSEAKCVINSEIKERGKSKKKHIEQKKRRK